MRQPAYDAGYGGGGEYAYQESYEGYGGGGGYY